MGCCLSKEDGAPEEGRSPQQANEQAAGVSVLHPTSFNPVSTPTFRTVNGTIACSAEVQPSTKDKPVTGRKSPSAFSKKTLSTPVNEIAKNSGIFVSDRSLSPEQQERLQPGYSVAKFISSRPSLSKDEAPMEACDRDPSPLKRSSSNIDLHDVSQLKRSYSGKSSSPLRAGVKQHQASTKGISDELMAKNRHAHRRASSREATTNMIGFHKRTSSRESTADLIYELRRCSPSRRPLSEESNNVPVRPPVSKEEDVRASAKHSAGKSQFANPSSRNRSSPSKTSSSPSRMGISGSGNRKSARKNERSPVRRRSEGKKNTSVAKSADCDAENVATEMPVESSSQVGLKVSASQGERVALKEISANRPPVRNDCVLAKQGMKALLDDKENVCNGSKEVPFCTPAANLDAEASETIEKISQPEICVRPEKAHEYLPGILSRSSSTKMLQESFVFEDGLSFLSSSKNEVSGIVPEASGFAMPASLSKAYSILQAIADMNMSSSLNCKDQASKNQIVGRQCNESSPNNVGGETTRCTFTEY